MAVCRIIDDRSDPISLQICTYELTGLMMIGATLINQIYEISGSRSKTNNGRTTWNMFNISTIQL